jgi:hypothetical protein
MGRWSHYDTDEERLPEGMTRIGYDADDETYTFRDRDGSIWESAPGNQYGRLRRISGPSAAPPAESGGYNDNDDDLEAPPSYEMPPKPHVSWRAEMMPLFNFFMIIGLFLIGVFFFLRATAGSPDTHKQLEKMKCGNGERLTPYTVASGDTCWAIAETRGWSVQALVRENANINCDSLQVGDTVCIPKSSRS